MPLHKMLQAVHLMMSSKKGISAKQLERMLGVTYKTAWFMAHRIRLALHVTNDLGEPLDALVDLGRAALAGLNALVEQAPRDRGKIGANGRAVARGEVALAPRHIEQDLVRDRQQFDHGRDAAIGIQALREIEKSEDG